MSDRNLYCYSCRVDFSDLPSIRTDEWMGSTYQAEKFIKHTLEGEGSTHDVNSVFADSSTGAYKEYAISSAASGALEIDKFGRHNYVWYAREEVGAKFLDGEFRVPTDTVKLVLPYDTERIHAFSVSSTGYQEERCGRCGRPILT